MLAVPTEAGSCMSQNTRPRVLLADDHPEILTALRRMLMPYCDIVGQASDGRALLEAAGTLRPDVIVLDVRMPGINGLEACRLLKQAAPDSKVVVLTAADDAVVRRKAFDLGASAFVLKYQVADRLVPAILEVIT